MAPSEPFVIKMLKAFGLLLVPLLLASAAPTALPDRERLDKALNEYLKDSSTGATIVKEIQKAVGMDFDDADDMMDWDDADDMDFDDIHDWDDINDWDDADEMVMDWDDADEMMDYDDINDWDDADEVDFDDMDDIHDWDDSDEADFDDMDDIHDWDDSDEVDFDDIHDWDDSDEADFDDSDETQTKEVKPAVPVQASEVTSTGLLQRLAAWLAFTFGRN